MAIYSTSSPWHKTGLHPAGHLDLLRIRPIPKSPGDASYVIEPQYTHRPDLLAYDLYGSPKLWWVFAQRNMDVIKDPIYDIEAGMSIYLPDGAALKRVLGV